MGNNGSIPPPRKSQVVIGFFKNTGKDPLEKQLGAIVSRGRFVRGA